MIITSNNKQKTSIISISQEANRELIALMEKEGLDPNVDFVRCGVNPGGCSGLSYELAFEKANETQLSEDEEVYQSDGIQILVGNQSKLYLAGSRLEYAGGLNGKGFYFNNPNAKRTCGCGDSFSS
jgi:iron-sulfur cluster assembly protein